MSTASNRRTTADGTTVYEIGTRNASTVLRLADGETQMLIGLIRDEDRTQRRQGARPRRSAGARTAVLQQDRHRQKTEIILSITPRVVRNMRRADAQVAEFWSGTEAAFRTQPLALRATTSDVPSIQVPSIQVPAGPASAAPQPANGAPPAQVAAVAPAAAAPAKAPSVEFSWIGPAAARVGEPVTLSLNAKSSEPMASASLQIS